MNLQVNDRSSCVIAVNRCDFRLTGGQAITLRSRDRLGIDPILLLDNQKISRTILLDI
jgi:hypothetical protein